MAIYHLSAKIISRSEGRSVTAAAAYRAGEEISDERTGETFDYTRREGVLESVIVAPQNAPAFVHDRAQLWNAVECAERRKDAQLAREVEVALPHELDHASRVELVQEFVRAEFTARGMVADVAFHAPSEAGDERNYHAHILLTTRELAEGGFGKKNRSWNDRALLEHWRESWAERVNSALERGGYDTRVDHRSFERQGIDQEPTQHLGPMASFIERCGRSSDIGDENRSIETRNADRLLERLTHKRAYFSEQELAKALFEREYAVEPNRDRLVSEGTILRLYDSETGGFTGYYTTPEVRAQEALIRDRAQRMEEWGGHILPDSSIRTALGRRSLSGEQRSAVEHVLKPGGWKMLEGRAGTGKSYTLGAVREAAELAGYQVLGLAPTNTVAADLKQSGFREARTVHSLLWHAEKGRPEGVLKKNSLVVVDEAAMLDTHTLDCLSARVEQAGAKLVLVGDDRQLESIQRGGMFTELKQSLGSAELSTVRRQEQGWARAASEDFAAGRFTEGLAAYREHGCIQWGRTLDAARRKLIESWREDTVEGVGSRFAFAYTNAEVNQLNGLMQEIEIARGRVSNLTRVETSKGIVRIGEGDRIQFRGTDKRLGILNGVGGTVEKIHNGRFDVKTDQGESVSFTTQQFSEIGLGYAGTIYRGQGRTLDQTYLLHSWHWHSQASYVAMTRARGAAKVFAAKDQSQDIEGLAKQMARRQMGGASLQFSTSKDNSTNKDAHRERAIRHEWLRSSDRTGEQSSKNSDRSNPAPSSKLPRQRHQGPDFSR